MATTKQAPKKAPMVSAKVAQEKGLAPVKPTAAEQLVEVLVLIDREAASPIDPAKVKFGKAVPLKGGGSVYINRSNADVRLTTGAVAALAKSIKGATVRGPQSNYLRIPLK